MLIRIQTVLLFNALSRLQRDRAMNETMETFWETKETFWEHALQSTGILREGVDHTKLLGVLKELLGCKLLFLMNLPTT